MRLLAAATLALALVIPLASAEHDGPNRPPGSVPVYANAGRDGTFYSFLPPDPDGDALNYTWRATGFTCGELQWPVPGSPMHNAIYAYPDCPPDLMGTIWVDATDGFGHVQSGLYNGTKTGMGDPSILTAGARAGDGIDGGAGDGAAPRAGDAPGDADAPGGGLLVALAAVALALIARRRRE